MKKIKERSTAAALTMGIVMCAATAQAAPVNFTTTHVFTKEDIQCARGVIGAACLGKAAVKSDGLDYYGIDSAYGWYAAHFNPAALKEKPMDGIFDDGSVANILDGSGNVIGISVRNPPTADWKTGPLGGEWLMGLGALKAKAGTEHLVVLDHMMRDPSDPNPLQEGIDYNTRMKDDGKLLYFWGNYNKEPTPVYIYAKMELPDRWKAPGANYTVTSARLLFDHNITNSPNDQVRPEDFENEYATGILPQYTICPVAPADAPNACSGLPAGTWVSAVASVEGGDGEAIPVGTVLKGLNPETGKFEMTNAWYTTLDRDPFGGTNPRFRLKSSKYGQDLPGVEIPQYVPDTPSTTNLDLLSILDPATGLPLLAESRNWNNFLDETSDIFGNYDPIDGYSIEDCPLTPDLDLMLYVKGEVGKPTVVRSAQLVITYECPDCNAAPVVDLTIPAVGIPASVRKSSVNSLTVSVANLHEGAVPATVTLTGSDKLGNNYSFGPTSVTTPADKSAVTVSYSWTAPPLGTTVTWTATVSNSNDITNLNNTATATTTVRK